MISKIMRKGKKKAFCILALAACLGLTGCSPIKVINKVLRSEEVSDQVQIVYRIVSPDPTEEEIKDTAYKLLKRAQAFSSGADVVIEGTGRLLVFLPSKVNEDIDIEDLAEELGNPGSLYFMTEDGEVVLIGADDIAGARGRTGTDKDTNAVSYWVELNLTDEGAEKFSTVTQENLGKTIAIIYDGELVSAPRVEAVITNGQAQITGMQSLEAADELASMISIGELSLELELYEIIED